MKISIIIPSYNEEENVGRTIDAIRSFFAQTDHAHELIVVDDGSTDGTAARVRALQEQFPGITLVCLDGNHGKGYAVREGMKLSDGDIVVFLDADGSTPIEELPKFIAAHERGVDIAIGSRYLHDSTIVIKQPWYRVLLGRLGNTLIQYVLLPGIRDTQCGFKSFARKVAHRLARLQTIDRWGFDMELLSIGRLLNMSLVEIPISWADSTNRVSRFRPIKDAHRTLSDLIRIKHNIRAGMYRELE